MSDEQLLLADDEDDNSQEDQFLLCKLENEEYGINISDVQSIEELQSIVSVPDMPDYVKGVINLRGQVIPVIDMRLKLRMADREYDDRNCIVIVKIGESNVGLIVDTVSEVVNIPESNIEPAPSFKDSRGSNRYISGIGKTGEEVKILLDVSKLLEEQEIEEIQTKA
jgi:purine-binding chemotaxis protein CheW